MPAVVRGGRRQASPAAPKAPSKQAQGKARGRAAAQTGKPRVIGSVRMPGEVTGWISALVVAGLLGVVLMTGHRAQTLANGVVNFTDARIAGFGLNLQNIRLVGVSDNAAPAVKAALHFKKGQPLALMDLNAVKAEVEQVGWVRSAVIRRQFPGTLVVQIVEKPPLAVWQFNQKDVVVDDQGLPIKDAQPGKFASLPFIVGEGANTAAPEIIELMRQRPALMQKTMALQRIDTRRWNIVLTNSSVIKLPALDQDKALGRLDTLMAQQRVLDQGFAAIDLLDPDSLVVIPLDARTPNKTAPVTPPAA